MHRRDEKCIGEMKNAYRTLARNSEGDTLET
jgi:hypothetical protein